MADHTFQFTLSGAKLSDQQKLQISNEIAVAVTKAVVGDSPQLLNAPLWSACRINGGKIFVDASALEVLAAVESASDKGLSAGLNPGGAGVRG